LTETPDAAGPEPVHGFRTTVMLYALGLGLGAYGWGALHESFHPLQLLDLLVYATLISILILVLPRTRWLQIPLATLCTLLLVLLHVGFLFYVRFYETWPTPAVFSNWRDALALGSSLLHLLRAGDVVFVVAAFVLLWMSVRAANRIEKRWDRANQLAGLVLLLELTFEACAAYPYMRSQNQPLMFLLRDPVMQMISVYLPRSKARVARVDQNIEKYYPLDADLYRFDRGPKAELRKVPLDSVATDEFRHMNVIVVIMESMRAHEFGLYGAKQSLTPNLDALGAESLVVDPFYANSHATIQGEAAVNCSAYEFASSTSIFRNFSSNHFTCLPAIFGARGYSTYWFNAYKKEFGNAYGFLRKHGTRKFFDIQSFHGMRTRRIGWGASDDDLFRLALRKLDDAPKPFYAEVLTLSNHYPFTQKYPTDPDFPGGAKYDTDYNNYVRGIFYADSAVGKFVEQLKQKSWWENTLLVINGDHGIRRFPDDPALTLPEKEEMNYRLPLIIRSGADDVVPKTRLHIVGSQVDIAPTVLDLLGLRVPNAFVGRSLLRVKPDEVRPIFMIQDAQWNIRRGDEYCYELAEKPGVNEQFKLRSSGVAANSPRFCFRTAGDLFFDRTIEPLPAATATGAPELYEFGLDLVFYNRFLLLRDAAWRSRARN